MAIISAHRCDIGQVRPHNDDYVWVDQAMGLFIAADGMGGYKAGHVASEMASRTVGSIVVNHLHNNPEQLSATAIKQLLTEAIETANRSIYAAAKQDQEKHKMGTTIVVALVYGPNAYISHAGDSRAYLARNATLIRLTEDDSWAEQFGMANPAKKGNGGKGPIDHILTKSVGRDADLDPSFKEISIEPDDWILLCSDGLWNMVEDSQILEILEASQNDANLAANNLLNAANTAGGEDNIAIVTIKILP